MKTLTHFYVGIVTVIGACHTAYSCETQWKKTILTQYKPPRVADVRFSADGRQLVTVGLQQSVRIWNVATGKKIAETSEDLCLYSATLIKNNSAIVGIYWPGSPLMVYDLKKKKVTQKIAHREVAQKIAHRGGIWDFACSQDGRRLITCARLDDTDDDIDNPVSELTVWNLKTGKIIARTKAKDHTIIHSIALSPDGKTLATGGRLQNKLTAVTALWNVRNLKRKRTWLHPSASWATYVEYGPQGNHIVVGLSLNYTYLLLDAQAKAEPKVLRTFKVPGINIGFVGIRSIWASFSRDGRLLAFISGYDEITLVDTATGKVKRKFRTKGAVWTLDLSPNGRILAAGTQESENTPSRVILWKMVGTHE